MGSIIPRSFRRNPSRAIRKKSAILGNIYRKVDARGVVSDFIADPVTTLLRPIFHFTPKVFIPKKRGELISVVVATRNNASTIHRALSSLLNQTYQTIEVIVVDDASDDGASEAIASLAFVDKRIIHVRNPSRLGTGASRNIGMRIAKGQYLTFHDGDDFSEPRRLQVQVEALQADPIKSMCLCNYLRVNSRGEGIEVNEVRVMKCIISMMFLRERILSQIGFFIEKDVSEDSDFYERVKIAFGDECEVVLPRTLYRALYRRGSSFFSSVEIIKEDHEHVRFVVPDETAAANAAIKAKHKDMRSGRAPTKLD